MHGKSDPEKAPSTATNPTTSSTGNTLFRRLFGRKWLISCSVLFLTFLLAGIISYRGGQLERWVDLWFQKRVIARVISAIQPSLPFRIDFFELDARWQEIQEGRLARFKSRLSYGKLQADLSGTLDLFSSGQNTWTPIVSAQGVLSGTWGEPVQLSPMPLPFQVDLTARVHVQWRELQFHLLGIGLNASPLPQETSAVRLTLQSESGAPTVLHVSSPALLWEWQTGSEETFAPLGSSHAQFTWKELTFEKTLTSPEEKIELSQAGGKIESRGAFNLKELRPTGVWSQSFQSSELEGLWNTRYFNLPLQEGGGQVDLQWSSEEPWSIERLDGAWTTRRHPSPNINASFHPKERRLSWNIRSMEIKEGFDQLREWPEFSSWKTLDLKNGVVALQGQAQLDESLSQFTLKGDLRLKNLSFRLPQAESLVEGLSLTLPLAPFSTHTAPTSPPDTLTIQADRIQWRGVRGRLKPTSISLKALPPNAMKGEIEFKIPKLPIELQSIPIQVGSSTGRFPNPLATEMSKDQPVPSPWVILESLRLHDFDLSLAREALCLPKRWTPPMTVNIDFQTILLSPSVIDPDGQLSGKVFGGDWVADQIGIYRLDTEVPEYDFSLNWRGLRLALLAEWLRFGGIDGKLDGYAHDVVLQSWLPTRYQFDFRILPDHSKKAIFTSRAMQNTVKILMGDSSSSLPGIAQWLIFDWPSRLLGDYAINFAGMTALSKDGLIELYSQTPSDILKEEKGTHFLLHSSRFKVPIRSEDHPVRIDAIAMSNFLRRVGEQIAALAQDESTDNTQSERNLEDETTRCPLPEFSP